MGGQWVENGGGKSDPRSGISRQEGNFGSRRRLLDGLSFRRGIEVWVIPDC
jgi:hypothetical protein